MKSASGLRLLLAVGCLALSACAPGGKSGREVTGGAPIAGAYQSSGETREFRRAAVFAAREESRRVGMPIRIVEVINGKTQVVAGTNLRLRVAAQRYGASTEAANVVVFRDLRGRYHLTSWRWK